VSGEGRIDWKLVVHCARVCIGDDHYSKTPISIVSGHLLVLHACLHHMDCGVIAGCVRLAAITNIDVKDGWFGWVVRQTLGILCG
jgi:hypothetical protein